MRKGILGSVAVWLAAGGMAAAQAPAYYPPAYPMPYPTMYRPAPPVMYPPAQMPYGYGSPAYPMAQHPGVMVGGALPPGQTPLPWFRNTHPMAQPALQGDGAPPATVTPTLPEPRPQQQQQTAATTSYARTPLIRRVASLFRPTEGSGSVQPLPPDGPPAAHTLPDAARPQPPAAPQPRYSGPAYAAPVHSSGPGCTDCGPSGACADGSGWCAPPSHGEHMPRRAPKSYSVYGGLEYLYWFIDEQDLPPVLVAGPTVIAGDVPGDNGERQGARFTAGIWLDPSNTIGIEASFFFLGEQDDTTFYGPGGVARTFIDVGTGAPVFLPVGNARIDSASRLWGGEGRIRAELARCCWGRIDMLTGIRYLNFDEDFAISDLTVAGGATTSRFDSFDTRNEFLGGLFGLEGEVQWRRFFLNTWGKVALGINRQEVNINGGTFAGGGFAPGGVLTGPTNIRSDSRNEFTVVPEVGVTVGWCITDQVRIGGGYNLLYINNVVRPASQIDPFVGGGRPLFLFRDEDFWAHGFLASLEVRF